MKAEALFYRCELHLWLGVEDIEEMHEQAEEMIPTLEARGDDLALSLCWRVVALQRSWASSKEAIDRAMEHARRAGDRRAELELLQHLAEILVATETPVQEALDRCEELLAVAGGDRVAEAAVRIIGRAGLLAMAGRFDDARRDVARATATFEELGLRLWLAASSTQRLAEIELMAGDPEASERELRRAIPVLEAMGARGWLSRHTSNLARALYEQGRHEEAERYLRIAEGIGIDPRGLLTKAKLLAARGEVERAERLAREAVADTEAGPIRAGALLDLAEVLHLCGRDEQSASVAEEAAELFERKGNIVLAGKARALLAELTA